MGHQISAGSMSIRFSRGADLVMMWCDRFTPVTKPENYPGHLWLEERIGVSEASEKSVKTANELVPMDYKTAKLDGFLVPSYRGEITEEDFNECRGFLKFAADHDLAICGSW